MVVNFRRWPSKTLFRGRTVLSWIRRWRSGQGGSLVTFCHHWSGKWMGNGWPWIYLRDSFSMDLWLPKWCYRWIPRTSWETRITTRYYEFYEFCPSTVSWFDDEAGCFFDLEQKLFMCRFKWVILTESQEFRWHHWLSVEHRIRSRAIIFWGSWYGLPYHFTWTFDSEPIQI